MYDKTRFLTPDTHYRINPMVHNWPQERELHMQALRDYGFGGAVTNVPTKNGWVANPENIETFRNIMEDLEQAGLSYWLYDEVGYPSGKGNCVSVEGHPEWEAKGLYMVRRVSYEEHRHISFHIDDETDKIVWAAKYPIITQPIWESDVPWEEMQAVPFEKETLECDLGNKEVLFIFCVKTAFEGSHLTHNAGYFDRYINVMEPEAVKRFIEVAFEPLAAALPEALKKATYVFTDEPSLQVGYARQNETWSYALAPYSEALFTEFEKEYGYSLLPYLPLIFEGRLPEAAPIRIQFYKLVGKLIGRAYSGQLAAWCEAHGCGFSGHYLGEEYMAWHVKDYGDYTEVVRQASYPGIDLLQCYPEGMRYTTPKHGQMVVRKKHSNGMMVELCPFDGVNEFNASPLDNSCAIIGTLFSSGVRKVNSYIPVDYSDYDVRLKPATEGVRMHRKEARYLNEYTGRLAYMLDGLHNDCNTFIYYGLEDMQAKLRPHHSGTIDPPREDIDLTTYPLVKRVYEAGFDFYFADRDDLTEAMETLKNGTPTITGYEVKTIIVPGMDVIHSDTLRALAELQKAGVKVFFHGKMPTVGTDKTMNITACCEPFTLASEEDILAHLSVQENRFTAQADDAVLLKSRYLQDGKEMYFICNNSRQDASVRLHHAEWETATLYNPADGTVEFISLDAPLPIAALRGVFVVFE